MPICSASEFFQSKKQAKVFLNSEKRKIAAPFIDDIEEEFMKRSDHPMMVKTRDAADFLRDSLKRFVANRIGAYRPIRRIWDNELRPMLNRKKSPGYRIYGADGDSQPPSIGDFQNGSAYIEVTCKEKGLRVLVSKNFFLNLEFFGAPSDPAVRGWIRPGHYVFGTDGVPPIDTIQDPMVFAIPDKYRPFMKAFDPMFIASSSYGPFAPIVGYAGAIMASIGAVFTMWGGRMKTWRPPDRDMPGTAQKIVLLICAVLMVVEWYFARPEYGTWMIGAAAVMSLGTLICYLRYNSLLRSYRYEQPFLRKGKEPEWGLFLGGRELKPYAQAKLGDTKTVQSLRADASYDRELLWDRPSLAWVSSRALTTFILMLVLGTSTLTTLSFAVQVNMTKKAAVSVVSKPDTPNTR